MWLRDRRRNSLWISAGGDGKTECGVRVREWDVKAKKNRLRSEGKQGGEREKKTQRGYVERKGEGKRGGAVSIFDGGEGEEEKKKENGGGSPGTRTLTNTEGERMHLVKKPEADS